MKETQRKIDKDKLQDISDLSQYIGQMEGQWVKDLVATQRELYNVPLKPPPDEQLEIPEDYYSDQIYEYESVRRIPSAP